MAALLAWATRYPKSNEEKDIKTTSTTHHAHGNNASSNADKDINVLCDACHVININKHSTSTRVIEHTLYSVSHEKGPGDVCVQPRNNQIIQ